MVAASVAALVRPVVAAAVAALVKPIGRLHRSDRCSASSRPDGQLHLPIDSRSDRDIGRIGPVVGCIGPVVGCIGPVVGCIGPVVGCIGPVVGCIGPVVG